MKTVRIVMAGMVALAPSVCLGANSEPAAEQKLSIEQVAKDTPEELVKMTGSWGRVLGAAEECNIDKERLTTDLRGLFNYIDANGKDNNQKGYLVHIATKGLDAGKKDVSSKQVDCGFVDESLKKLEPYMRR